MAGSSGAGSGGAGSGGAGSGGAGSNALGEYLRARRELVDPADAGVRVTGVPRTPGLRREEVATLAGISADYYLRLEQGRDRTRRRRCWRALPAPLGTARRQGARRRPDRIRHPEVGTLELRREKLTIGETDGQLLVIYHAEPGSDSARSLALLGSLAVTDAGSEVSDPSRS